MRARNKQLFTQVGGAKTTTTKKRKQYERISKNFEIISRVAESIKSGNVKICEREGTGECVWLTAHACASESFIGD